MKKITWALWILCFLSPFLSKAQCEGCMLIAAEKKVDYCYKDSLFQQMCVQFIDDQPHFYLDRKKSPIKITAPKEGENITSYLLNLIGDKKLKITSKEVLFIQAALDKWKFERKKIGYKFDKTGLGIKILKEGTGELPEKGKTVIVHYTGTLLDGKKFDSSVDRGQPFKFPLGQGRVIKGWDDGIAQLKIGTKALLFIPAELGYGNRGAGAVIPPNATLIFEVELLGVE